MSAPAPGLRLRPAPAGAARGHSARLAGFALLPALSMLAPLVLLPLVSARFGAAGWGALAIGQSIGAVLSFVLGMTWPIVGGHRVAIAGTEAERRDVFRLSMATRGCLLLLLLPVGAIPTVLLAPGYQLEAALFMVAVTLNGFTAAWYFAGIATPRAVVVNEGLLRFGAYLVAVAGLLAGLDLWWYAAAMVLGGVAMAVANGITVLRGDPRLAPVHLRAVLAELAAQARATSSRGLQSLFYYGGVTVVALVAPPALALFAAADQVQKAANNGLSILPMSFVAWLGASSAVAERRRRGRRAFAVVAAIAGAAIGAWLLVGEQVAGILFAGRVQLGFPLIALIGAVILVFVLSRSAELLLLVPVGLDRIVWRSNRVASPVGLVLVAAGAATGGVVGALVATLATEVASLVYYLLAAGRSPREP